MNRDSSPPRRGYASRSRSRERQRGTDDLNKVIVRCNSNHDDGGGRGAEQRINRNRERYRARSPSPQQRDRDRSRSPQRRDRERRVSSRSRSRSPHRRDVPADRYGYSSGADRSRETLLDGAGDRDRRRRFDGEDCGPLKGETSSRSLDRRAEEEERGARDTVASARAVRDSSAVHSIAATDNRDAGRSDRRGVEVAAEASSDPFRNDRENRESDQRDGRSNNSGTKVGSSFLAPAASLEQRRELQAEGRYAGGKSASIGSSCNTVGTTAPRVANGEARSNSSSGGGSGAIAEGRRTGPPAVSSELAPADVSKPPQQPADKPNFGLSGALATDAATGNMYKGVLMKWSEPPDAATPSTKWRLHVFKGKEQLDKPLHIYRQSAFLVGRDRAIADVPTDHPSCSGQHAVIQFRRVLDTARGADALLELDGSSSGGVVGADASLAVRHQRIVKPYIMDLESTNGTFLNGKRVEPARYVELRALDVLKFGLSSREYVLLHDDLVK